MKERQQQVIGDCTWMRVHMMKVLFIALLSLFVYRCTTPDHDYLVYVGTYTGKGSDGIYVYRFNSISGNLTPIGLAAKTENPSYIVIDSHGDFLYAVNETDLYEGESTGSISVFTIDRESGALTLVQQISSLGAAPCHLSFDRSGRYLMVANYNGGTAAVFPVLANGRLDSRTAFIRSTGSSVNPGRQDRPHVHSIQPSPDNRFVMITDLGSDKLGAYRFDAKSGSLDPLDSGEVMMEPGSGPRHITFTPTGTYGYVINELTSTVAVFSLDKDSGRMKIKQTISTLPDTFIGTNTSAEIITINGKYLYVSNRGSDTIVLFLIDENNGQLSPVEWVSTAGRAPRHFEIDPSGRWLLAANQQSSNLVLFSIDPSSGHLRQNGIPLNVFAPVCVRFIPVQ